MLISPLRRSPAAVHESDDRPPSRRRVVRRPPRQAAPVPIREGPGGIRSEHNLPAIKARHGTGVRGRSERAYAVLGRRDRGEHFTTGPTGSSNRLWGKNIFERAAQVSMVATYVVVTTFCVSFLVPLFGLRVCLSRSKRLNMPRPSAQVLQTDNDAPRLTF